MADRKELHLLLVSTLGNNNVFFQPPPTIRLCYPAVVYKLEKINKTVADNKCYGLRKRYQITVIYRDADSDLPVKFASLDKCVHNQHYTSDNLYHDVFTLEF